MKMKNYIYSIAIIAVIFVFNITAYAKDEINDIFIYADELGQDAVTDIPENAKEFLYDLNVDINSLKDIINLPAKEIFKSVKEIILNEIRKPIKTLASITALIIICAYIEGLGTSFINNDLSGIFSTISVLCISSTIILPIVDCIKKSAVAIADCANFMITLVPTLTAVMTVSGQPTTASTYNIMLFGACQVVSNIANGLIVPLMGIYMAFCIVGSATENNINIYSITNGIKNIVNWMLGFVMCIFVAVLSIQSFVGSATDTVSSKAVKFVIGSFVPVIGSALSEAFSVTQGCVKVLQSALGAFGVAIAIFTFLPILVKLCIWYVTLSVASFVGDFLGTKSISNLLKNISMVIGLMISMVLAFGVLLIISTTLILMIGAGAK